MKDWTWNGWTREELVKAVEFYDQSPDGQYDNLAADCIRRVLSEQDWEHTQIED